MAIAWQLPREYPFPLILFVANPHRDTLDKLCYLHVPDEISKATKG